MKKLEHFELKKDYAVFCPVGQSSVDKMADLISRAVLGCRKEKVEKLLIDSTGVSGFRPSVVAERYNFIERISSNAKASFKIAHVASPEWVRSGKFGVIVAKNRGLEKKLFRSTTMALEWLLKSNESSQPNNPP